MMLQRTLATHEQITPKISIHITKKLSTLGSIAEVLANKGNKISVVGSNVIP